MKAVEPINKDGTPIGSPESETTGLPGLRTWSSIYWLVTGVFVVVVVLLAMLTQMFS